MGQFIHRNGTKYRVWSTIVDAYLTPPMGLAAMGNHLVAEGASGAEANARLARATANGTSRFGDARPTDRWDTERCRECAGFHHAFRPWDDDPLTCGACGEPESDEQHLPPCKPPRTRKAVA